MENVIRKYTINIEYRKHKQHHKMSNENCSQHENWGSVWGTGKGRPPMQAVDIVLCSYTVP